MLHDLAKGSARIKVSVSDPPAHSLRFSHSGLAEVEAQLLHEGMTSNHAGSGTTSPFQCDVTATQHGAIATQRDVTATQHGVIATQRDSITAQHDAVSTQRNAVSSSRLDNMYQHHDEDAGSPPPTSSGHATSTPASERATSPPVASLPSPPSRRGNEPTPSSSRDDSLPPRPWPPAPLAPGTDPKTPKTANKFYDKTVAGMLTDAQHAFECLLFTKDAYPDLSIQVRWSLGCWEAVCKSTKTFYELSKDMLNLVRNCLFISDQN